MKNNFKKLTPDEERIIIHKDTEASFSGRFNHFFKPSIYQCKRCGAALYKSESKFEAGCGWPAFDDEIKGAIKRIPDPDGIRTEISCANCGAHLGHVLKVKVLPRKMYAIVLTLPLSILCQGKKTKNSKKPTWPEDVFGVWSI